MTAKVTHVWMAAPALQAVLDSVREGTTAEPCGLLLGYRRPLGAEVLEAVPVRNAHETPSRAFRMETEALLVAGRAGRARGLDIVGIWHGHLQGPAWPGDLDVERMREWQNLNPQSVWVVIGRGTTGRSLVRAFRLGRTRPKKVRLLVLKRARGTATVRSAPPAAGGAGGPSSSPPAPAAAAFTVAPQAATTLLDSAPPPRPMGRGVRRPTE